MKRLLSIILIILLVSPAFASWLPHDVVYSLHKNNLEHYVTGSHDHSNQRHVHEQSQLEHVNNNKNHDINQDIVLSDHHPVYFDITTYFSDTLGVELQRASLSLPNFTAFDFSDRDFLLATFKKLHLRHDAHPSKSHIPLHWKITNSSHIPLYLATARLRI
jgi:hypothetical protein